MEKTTQDGFTLELITPDKARELFSQGKDLFALYDDDTEALIEYDTDLDNAIDHNIQIGYERTN